MRPKRIILGIDEVGRGPIAGPLVVGAVILPSDYPEWIDDLTDSKKIGPTKRRRLADIILKEAPATGLGWVSARELDHLGLSESLRLATRRAVNAVRARHVPFTEIIIDGDVNFLKGTTLENYTTTVVKGDLLIKEVSAASIIAKVARDNYMIELAKVYPEYGFEKHVGYGTAKHLQALETYGPTPEHRTSFRPVAALAYNKYYQTMTETPLRKNTTKIGTHAEQVVANYLEHRGHTILTRNHKTPFYEIDIISEKADKIYFTEVKYRHNSRNGSPLAAITAKKQQQMHYAAESFLRYSQTNLQPVLAAASVSGPDFRLDQWFTIE